ncbi:SidA/IucD/PvdA family monooxygenase [Sphaerisporangium sp. TRM90804]|uniref:lysine N(6)-hydroxylase/L-ornithine N(5)-oxygenase family protein n=1 Tax=Sphaerisporangium sp. TRM90804 TaxID=3031113 RepID=UPI002449E703|nr:SidA/IucD/PvdA family monooxygenase [Sphaerisporangium sp. TRM90804]MDH2425013.1 SidA/IucD/PvdA family monooxygenase [Sphaerisporangium sp. TRM90804]
MTEVYDYAAVGVGPANLSLAALGDNVENLRGVHLEARESAAWHPGLLLPEATLQVSPLKDLVTLVDPTSRYSFLAFLAAEGRLYRFLTARFPSVLRTEFDQYLQWASRTIPSIEFGVEVRSVSQRDGDFVLRWEHGEVTARNVVLGTGQTPFVPACMRPHLCSEVFHAGQYLLRRRELSDRAVTVVGGGQSGAEIVRHLMRLAEPPRSIDWITRRPGLLPMDDSPFTNEYFFPGYAREFHGLPETSRRELLAEQKYASDGIDLATLEDIYRERYRHECLLGRKNWLRLMCRSEVRGCERLSHGWQLEVQGPEPALVRSDVVILATGYEYRLPAFMRDLAPRLAKTAEGLVVGEDFSLALDGRARGRVFLQNGARHAWGVADPNLSLLSWRSAVILNAILGYRRYNT